MAEVGGMSCWWTKTQWDVEAGCGYETHPVYWDGRDDHGTKKEAQQQGTAYRALAQEALDEKVEMKTLVAEETLYCV